MFLSSIYGTNDKPSFLELVSQEQLLLGLRPALDRVLHGLCERFSGQHWLRALHRRTDELWLLILLVVEGRSLYSNGATVAESFYGLRRRTNETSTLASRPKEEHGPAPGLPAAAVWKSVLESAILPYLRTKLDALYQEFYIQASLGLDGFWSCFWKRLFLRLYPFLRTLDHCFVFLFRLLYLFGRTEYYSWPLRLERIVVVRAPYAAGLVQGRPAATLLQRFLDRAFSGGKLALIVGLYTLRFVDWFRSNLERERREQVRSLPLPPPPEPLGPPQTHAWTPGACALCHRADCCEPSVCLVSGFVFCDACLREHIKIHRRCPITKFPASELDIRRLYFSDAL
ncbi:similar to C3HC4 zinc-binding integral peroxisomal membrane protein PEX12 [Cyanidioschyzon merolae strain 10D]|jgi:peroxin-12|uniref:Peroxisome assembly protein 12 n=1 Tax=Cyanidioschyzon merolae (strain NIES-3377 / 10D) TaxID=280699 RepID=M1UUD3_CYAM1|nr:similar to C3HC4 zinc-binding integral peroxisomal membrane protein PEX12 [Cyanidioschyzon merolae strain 10D]BAM81461.1 similar to C3HC4 zinc-binding integral peroxisomal membrane protein PEX12 [Cyanidioschyzon merolae strain 10D]|eukprot:XP_005537497.1 similar to C3HC4 zinc-binding integral peroxisomal membrane protein PEX12 [Cyanidioschyzon merolae strain 10D]